MTSLDLDAWATRYGLPTREVEIAVHLEARLGHHDETAWRVDDRGSGLARHVLRLLTSAGGQLDTQSLRAGLTRARRHRATAAPTGHELLLWLSGQPWLTLDGDTVRISGSLTDRQAIWSSTTYTAILAQALRAAPSGELSYAELVDALVATGYAPHGARALVSAAPNLERVRHGRYRLRQHHRT